MRRRQGRSRIAARLLAVMTASMVAFGAASMIVDAPLAQAQGQRAPASGAAPAGATPAAGAAPAGAAPAAGAPAGADGGDAGETADTGEADGSAAAPDQEALDIDALRQEYLRLRDELFRSRARAATVASALYSTRIRILLDYDSARYYAVTRATVRLDGAGVYDDTSGAIGTDKAPRFEGYVAPGRHQLGVRIEAVGKDDERFTSIIDNTFTIQAPAGKDVIVRVSARDDGDIPYAWEKKQRGSYGLRLDVAVEAVGRGEADDASGVRRRK